MSKYYFEIDCNGAEASGYEDRFPWVCYGTIVAEGDSLETCLEGASVDLVDQDGGEAGIVEADADWMQRLIVEAYWRELGQVRRGKETFSDFMARVDRGEIKGTDPDSVHGRDDV